jgi:hypothetical protein
MEELYDSKETGSATVPVALFGVSPKRWAVRFNSPNGPPRLPARRRDADGSGRDDRATHLQLPNSLAGHSTEELRSLISHGGIPGRRERTHPHHSKWPCPGHSLDAKLLNRSLSHVREKDGAKQLMPHQPGNCFPARRATPTLRLALPISKPPFVNHDHSLP